MNKKKPILSTTPTESDRNFHNQTPQTKQSATRTESMRNTATKLFEFFTTRGQQQQQPVSTVGRRSSGIRAQNLLFSDKNMQKTKDVLFGESIRHEATTPTVKMSNHLLGAPTKQNNGVKKYFLMPTKRTNTGGEPSTANQSKITSYLHSSTGGVPREITPDKTKLIKNSKGTALALKATAQKSPNLLIFRFQKQVIVDGIGEYTVEVTNVVDAKTMQVQPLFPSLMNSENLQQAKIRQEQMRHRIQQSISPGVQSQIDQEIARLQIQSQQQIAANQKQIQKEYLPKLLKHIVVQRLQKQFRQLKFGSLSYKRDLQNHRTLKIVQMVKTIANRQKFCLIVALANIKYRSAENRVLQKTCISLKKTNAIRDEKLFRLVEIWSAKAELRMLDVFHKLSLHSKLTAQKSEYANKKQLSIQKQPYQKKPLTLAQSIRHSADFRFEEPIPEIEISAIHTIDQNQELNGFMDFSVIRNSKGLKQVSLSEDEENDLIGELENVLESLKQQPAVETSEERKDDEADVVRLMDRLNELDGDHITTYFDNADSVVKKNKKKMLGLNDSREHDFDM